jgi:retron-type reverse transcriptase
VEALAGQAGVHPESGRETARPGDPRDRRQGAASPGVGRGCHDAIEAIYEVGKGASPARRWALDADLAAASGRIGHPFLLSQLGTFPARELVAGWLRAGVVEDGRFTPTGEGTPQGGVFTPPTQ